CAKDEGYLLLHW
nr:immunoglobulin heavy chain junction region [Macaca mulatta]MOY21951.1 immunoglobulin heavy chain junction region [Macaca mulatta]MOY22492.1 immunoglobulin heavy chain junction region [Macaca mulatta]MOY26310.1 immunoglobulin heavy chain junction region [Macaca mulatta]MOY27827.1 immunoglobulin heavy chain junction region [Macaca mulatta]